MENNVSQQLITEIKKLKERDYSSYQNFYSQTSQYLYGVIWETMPEQEAANTLLQELYTDIYESIGEELTDDTMFFEWAQNKARKMSETYAATHVITSDKADEKIKDAAMIAVAGIAGDISAPSSIGMPPVDGSVNAGMSQVSAGNVNAGMNQASSGNMNMGMSQASSGNINAGMGQASSGNTQMGSIGGSSHSENVQVLANNATTGASAKTGMALGTKVALAVAGVATVVGIGVTTFLVTKPKDKDKDQTTVEATLEAGVTEEVTEEVTTEAAVDPEIAERYEAYYNMLVNEDGTMPTKEDIVYNLPAKMVHSQVRLVDFNGDGKKQLVIVDDDYNEDGSEHMVYVYDYVDGGAVPILEVDYTNTDYNFTMAANISSNVDLVYEPDGKVSLVVYDPDEDGTDVNHGVKKYVYDDGAMVIETTEFEYYNVEGYSYDHLADDGATPYAALYVDYNNIEEYAYSKIEYDKVIEELATNAGIDTSSVWKTVYLNKIQELKDTFYANDYSGTQNEGATYSFALEDLNNDGIPELIGKFNGWDGGNNFIMTCSKYGTYEYIHLYRGVDISSSENYVNVENGYIRTQLYDYDVMTSDMTISFDDVYYLTRGAAINVGALEDSWFIPDNAYSRDWLWREYSETRDTYANAISESEFNSKASSYAGNQNLYEIFDYVESVDEITGMIENY